MLECVCREEVPADATKEGPLCMNQSARLFGHARIPGKPRDTLVTPFPYFLALCVLL